MTKTYIFYSVCALIALFCILQDDIIIVFQDIRLNEGKLKNVAVITKDTVEFAQQETVKTEPQKVFAKTSVQTVKPKSEILPVEKMTSTSAPAENSHKHLNKKVVKSNVDRTVTSVNNKTYEGLENALLACIAYVENFSETSYYCGKMWTIGYGTTAYTNGASVLPNQRISREYALECVRFHIRRYVFPIIERYVDRELSQGEMIATAMLIYNIGGGNFINWRGLGPCAFLKALNNGEDSEECARKMTELRYSAGNISEGLLKRRWVESAIFCEYLTIDNILLLSPAGFYNARDLTEYYTSCRPDQDGLYSYKLSQAAVDIFLEKNQGKVQRVIDII